MTQQRGCVVTHFILAHVDTKDEMRGKKADKLIVLPSKMCVCVCAFFFTPQELKLKDKECERLSQVRNQLEQELEELTASLFEVSRKSVTAADEE